MGDALRLYLKEHLKADSPETDSRVTGLATRVVEAAIAAIGRDPLLTAITREEARAVRDHMLDRVKATGRRKGQRGNGVAGVGDPVRRHQLRQGRVWDARHDAEPVQPLARGAGGEGTGAEGVGEARPPAARRADEDPRESACECCPRRPAPRRRR
ncbi:hypothetical protein ACTTAF_10855 [Rhodobacter capsulatus]|uniref:hypothetical protein n=1 Tax=Rhodobacter capsulatus TaxID=1061 RepID=UPI004038CC85